MNKIVALFLISLILVSCSKKVLIRDVGKKKFEVQNIDFETFNSRAKIRYDNGDKSLSLNANIRIKKDSVIWVSLSAFLGIEVARALITPDSMILINRLDHEFEVMSYRDLSSKFNFEIDYDLIQAMLLGNMPRELNLRDELKKNKEVVTVRQLLDQYLVENYINSKTLKLERVFIEEIPTKNTLNFAYGGFNKLEKSIFPYSSDILLTYNTSSGSSQTEINIDHNKVDIQNTDLSFPFEIPEKYHRR
ncbi:MAG: DUF4292 domain-containing protein [Cyclobacteriaceae bacterium]